MDDRGRPAGTAGGGAGAAAAPPGPDPGLVASAAHVFVEDLEAPRLSEADMSHLARTLRLRPGEAVSASDGEGRWRCCRWRGAGMEGSCIEADGPVVSVAAAQPCLTVGFALTKGDRPEAVVRGLTELGVDRIIPLSAARCVVRWEPGRAAQHLARLRRVAREAAMQSRRVRLPEVASLSSVAEVVARLQIRDGAVPAPGGAMAQPGGGPVSLDNPVILVGPEGGWSEIELGLGLGEVGLGPGILRAETAALAVGTLLCALRAGLVCQQGDRPAPARRDPPPW